MEDRSQEALKRYRLKIYNMYKARGAYIIESDSGLKLFKVFEGSKNRALFEHKIKEHLYQNGYPNVDLFVKTVEDDIISEDSNRCQYIMKNWFWGEECNLMDLSQVEAASANLARLHNILTGIDFNQEQIRHNVSADLAATFDKRNRELKRVKAYIREKRQKNEFELCYLSYYDDFYENGLFALDLLTSSCYDRLVGEAVQKRQVCHGNYTYHNIIMIKNKTEAIAKTYIPPGWINRQPVTISELAGGNEAIATTNFEKAYIGLQIYDLYQFIRKVMEKNDWDIAFGNSVIDAYDRIRPISGDEMRILYILLLYPEKFWKITNYYYNSKKSWISGRNTQKLKLIGEQNTKKEIFLKSLEALF